MSDNYFKETRAIDAAPSVQRAESVAPRTEATRDAPRAEATRNPRSTTPGHTATPDEQQTPPVTRVRQADRVFRAGDRIHHYELIRELGQGGMGQVFLARDVKLARLVAIKLIHGRYEGSNSLYRRFFVEARATARCRHENIVTIHDINDHGGRPYMVLEYLQGQSLRDMSKGRPMTPARAVELMLPVARALRRAHEHGIVHRDLKPGNILVTDEGQVKLLDFGIAKLMTINSVGLGDFATLRDGPAEQQRPSVITGTLGIVGTLPYMAPEQMNSGDADVRSDIWAVGMVLYELLLGHHLLEPVDLSRLHEIADMEHSIPPVARLVPHVGKLGDLIAHCLIKDRSRRLGSTRELVSALEALTPGRGKPRSIPEGSPFPGLTAFQTTDGDRFFGRDREIARLIARLRSHPLVVLVGPSGSGKSSLVRAGVLATLERSEHASAHRRPADSWRTVILRPGRQPTAALARVLQQLGVADSGEDHTASDESHGPVSWAERLDQEPGSIGQALRTWARRNHCRVAILIDQFEELYTLVNDRDERRLFIRCLEGVADDPSSPLRLILTIRSDFLDRTAEDSHFTAEVMRSLMLLSPMTRPELREALTRPLEELGHGFEDDALIETMLDDLHSTSGALPLLQFAGAQLWQARDRARRLLTRDSYDRIGGVAGALASHADAVLAGMTPAKARIARIVFERLVTPERTRALATWSELRQLHDDPDTVEKIVRHLADARLLLLEKGEAEQGTTVELIHESLIESWTTLAQWLDENRVDGQFMARLRKATELWIERDHADDVLWRGQTASEAEVWRTRHEAGAQTLWLGTQEKRYLDAVVSLARRSRRRRRLLAASVVGGLVVTAVVVAVLAIRADRQATFAAQQARRADLAASNARMEATRARDMTRLAVARERRSDPTESLAILREIESSDPPRGWATLMQEVRDDPVAREILAHDDEILTIMFAANGVRVATTSNHNILRIWNHGDPSEPMVLGGHEDRINAARFSPDGQRIVTASQDRTARVWNLDGSGTHHVLDGHGAGVSSVHFSPDGARILTISLDNTARMWNADGSGAPVVLEGHRGTIASADFSPDGLRVVTASWDKTARVWNTDGSGEPVIFRGHDGAVASARFDSTGRSIVTASWDRTAQVWNADGRGEPLLLHGHEADVVSAEFSPDGEHLVTASRDGTARLWRVDDTTRPTILRGHGQPLSTARFSPDGRWVVTTSADSRAQLWRTTGDVTPTILRGHEKEIIEAEFSADGKSLVTASRDGSVRLWSPDDDSRSLAPGGHAGLATAVDFSPDGARVVMAARDGTARIWNIDGSGESIVLRGHEGPVTSARFNPAGTRIVTASKDRTARVWNADGSGRPVILRGHEAGLDSAEFGPDGARILTRAKDRTARLWQATGLGTPMVLRGHSARLTATAFSPDGRRVVTTSWDRTARVHDTNGRGGSLILDGHDGPVLSAEFSPDSARIVTVASYDEAIRVWNSDGGGLVTYTAGSPVIWAGFSRDGEQVVAMTRENRIWIWRLDGDEEPTAVQKCDGPRSGPLTGAVAETRQVQLSPDGERLVVAFNSEIAWICNIDGSGEPLGLRGHTDDIIHVVFSAHGRRVATTSRNGSVRVWNQTEPITRADDSRLWTATAHCMPVERRMELLGVTREKARSDRQACLDRVGQEWP